MRSKQDNKRLMRNNVDTDFEQILLQANKSLEKIEQNLINKLPVRETPVIFFCFAPRSGSTIISQYLAKTGYFNYVSNFMARFWLAPYLAGLIEAKLGLRDNATKTMRFNSNFGVTSGFSSPHEFGFFWNKWLPYSSDSHRLSTEERKKINKHYLKQEINAILSLSNNPLFFKNSLAGINAGFFAELFPNAKFIIVKRNIAFTCQSLLISRKKLLGDYSEWWSLKPTIYPKIKNLPFYEQTVKQVQGIYSDIEDELKEYSNRIITITYEDFCENPKKIIKQIFNFVGLKQNSQWEKNIGEKPTSANSIKIKKTIFDKLNI